MTYKSLLVYVDEAANAAERITLAARLALAHGAHLSGVTITGIAQLMLQNATFEFAEPNLGVYFDVLRKRGEKTLEPFAPLARAAGLTDLDTRLLDDESANGFLGCARCADLVILGQRDPAHPGQTVTRDFIELVILNAGRPVLMVPHAGSFPQLGQKILIAWDGSAEAARAVAGALPLLKRAGMVDIVILNAISSGVPAEEPGQQLATYLKRHGVMADVSHQRSKESTGAALLSLAADLSSDLLVMGAYGHSRFREMLMGGATRTLLASMTLPVLMAH